MISTSFAEPKQLLLQFSWTPAGTTAVQMIVDGNRVFVTTVPANSRQKIVKSLAFEAPSDWKCT